MNKTVNIIIKKEQNQDPAGRKLLLDAECQGFTKRSKPKAKVTVCANGLNRLSIQYKLPHCFRTGVMMIPDEQMSQIRQGVPLHVKGKITYMSEVDTDCYVPSCFTISEVKLAMDKGGKQK